MCDEVTWSPFEAACSHTYFKSWLNALDWPTDDVGRDTAIMKEKKSLNA